MLSETMSLCLRFVRCVTYCTSCVFALVSSVGCGSACAHVGYRVLNEPAITARRPDLDLLEAITRAGSRLVAVGEHGIIIFSDDDGESWHQAAVPVDLTLNAVAFATPQDGWAAGALGVVLHTTDGGMRWKVEMTGVQVNQLIAVAAHQFAASHPTDPAAQRAVRRANIFVQAGPDKPFFVNLAIRFK